MAYTLLTTWRAHFFGLYLDGNLVASSTAANTATSIAWSIFRFGWGFSTSRDFNGDIALIACFASSWTPAMVRRCTPIRSVPAPLERGACAHGECASRHAPSTGTGVVTFLMGSSEWPFVSASCCVWLGRSNRRDLLRILAAQKLWHMSEAHLLELSEKGFWRRTAVQFTTLRIRHALAVPMNATPIFEGKATVVPPPEPPWLIEPEEQTGMMVPVAELTMFERQMTEPEHEVAIAELEHQTALAEVPEVSRLEPWDMSELG